MRNFKIRRIPKNSDLVEFAWSGLRRFTSIDFVVERLVEYHSPPKGQKQNIKKQAVQIQACLRQAKEYSDAAVAASHAIKPVLLYYAASSLATAQTLFLATGDFSLDRKRASYNQHGLYINPSSIPNELSNIPVQLRRDGNGSLAGTFGLWFDHAVLDPIVGDRRVQTVGDAGGSLRLSARGAGGTIGPSVVSNLERISDDGSSHVDVLDCLRNIPELANDLREWGIQNNLCRAAISLEAVSNSEAPELGSRTFSITVHPDQKRKVDQVAESISVSPNAVSGVEILEHTSGFSFTVASSMETQVGFKYPDGCSRGSNETYLRAENFLLNEFGCLYVPLYAASMWSRYNQEGWMKSTYNGDRVAILMERLCDLAIKRLPMLTLECLERTVHINIPDRNPWGL